MAVPRTKLIPYAEGRPDEVHRTLLAETRYLSFNTTRPPLGDVRVRRALALAIDRRKVVDRVLLGGQQPAERFLPPALRRPPDASTAPGESPPAPPPGGSLAAEQRFDPAEARRLLAAAGFASGKNFPPLELTAWSRSQTSVLEAIQEMWSQELGLDVAIAFREAKVHLESLRRGDYDIGFVTTLLDVPDSLALFGDFASGAPNNLPHWRSEEYDRLLSQAMAQADRPGQARELLAAEALLLEQAPVAPVYFNTRNWLMARRVRGWQDDPLWTRFYHDVYLEGK